MKNINIMLRATILVSLLVIPIGVQASAVQSLQSLTIVGMEQCLITQINYTNGATEAAPTIPSSPDEAAARNDAEGAAASETETGTDMAALQEIYMNYLLKEGYQPEVDEDGDVRFKREGRTYYIDVIPDDAEFFRIVLPAIWPIDDKAERYQAFKAMNQVMRLVKSVKMFTVRDDVWVTVEMFVNEPAGFKPLFPRIISVIEGSTTQFVYQMRLYELSELNENEANADDDVSCDPGQASCI